MPVAVSLRFDDDVASLLRERAQLEHRSINQLVNVVMRAYLQGSDAAGNHGLSEREQARAILAGLPSQLDLLNRALKPLEHQETKKDYHEKTREAVHALANCVQTLSMAIAPETIPVVRRTSREDSSLEDTVSPKKPSSAKVLA